MLRYSLILLVIVSLLLLYYIVYRQKIGKIILLQGTSSSGKSAILKELQKMQPANKVFKVDDWWPDEMMRKAQEFGWQKESGLDPWHYLLDYVIDTTSKVPLGSELRAHLFTEVPDYYHEVKKAVVRGEDVIIDTVFEYDAEYTLFTDFFKKFKTIKVLVYCPLDTLLERVEQRNKSGVEAEKRIAYIAFEQFPVIYKLKSSEHEPIVDKISTQVMLQALEQAYRDLLAQQIPDKFLPALDRFKRDFINSFALNTAQEITIVPKHAYDLIMNSKSSSPAALAKEIIKKIG